MPGRRRPDPEPPTLTIFPDQIHIGERFRPDRLGSRGTSSVE